MLFKKEFKEGIRAGRITRSYRVWKRPQARSGNRYNLAPDGVIEVTAMTRVPVKSLTNSDAMQAGFADRDALLDYLNAPTGESIYRVEFYYVGPGSVRSPETTPLDTAALSQLRSKLAAMDQREGTSWTLETLELIEQQPGTRAAVLAEVFDWQTPRFKTQVRKLKALGLTLSLETGYTLTSRGNQLLTHLLTHRSQS